MYSQSSDGSGSRKRNIKSNKLLAKKKNTMTGGRIKEDINEESFGGADADAEEGVLISDDKAA